MGWNIYRMLNRISLGKSRVENVDWWLCLFWVHLFTKQTRHWQTSLPLALLSEFIVEQINIQDMKPSSGTLLRVYQATQRQTTQSSLRHLETDKKMVQPVTSPYNFSWCPRNRLRIKPKKTKKKPTDWTSPKTLLRMPMMHKGTGQQDRHVPWHPSQAKGQVTQNLKTLSLASILGKLPRIRCYANILHRLPYPSSCPCLSMASKPSATCHKGVSSAKKTWNFPISITAGKWYNQSINQ